MLILSKLLVVFSLIGLLRCSTRFRRMSKELDEQVFASLKGIMRTSEDHGYHPQLVPLLIIVTAVSFVLSAYVTQLFGR